MWRLVFLYFCGAVSFSICGLTINAVQVLLHFTVKKINLTAFQKINNYLCYTYFSLFNFFVDWYSNTELIVYMDKDDFKKYFGKEHAYIISNHSYEIDWILLLSLCEKAGCGGNSKTFIKNTVQYVPGFGNVLYFADYVCLARSFDKDKKIIENKIAEIVNYPDPVWLVLYPEGTRFTKQKHETSMKFAREKGLPELKYHLSPRTKGFTTSLPPMRGKMNALYDVTLAFDPNAENRPCLKNLFTGKKVQVHIYIKRMPFEAVPRDDNETSNFIHDLFIQKDKLRGSFYKTGDFFAESGVKKVDKFTIEKTYSVLINAILWLIFSVGLVLYYLVHLLISGKTITFICCIGFVMAFSFFMHKAMGMSKLDKASSYGISKNNNNKTS